MIPRKSRARLLAVAAAATAALLGGVAAPAMAAPTVDVDPGATGSIVVHKFEQPQFAQNEGTGLELESVPADWVPVDGVRFTASLVPGIDLTTEAGWVSASGMSVDEAAEAVGNVDPSEKVTGTDSAAGTATFEELPLGLYYVEEHLTPAQLTSGLTSSVPFLVTVPMTDPVDLNTWLYEVHVYPKNNHDAITKSVQDENTIGIAVPANANTNDVVWTINADIPEGGETDLYRIVDDLDSRLDHVSTEVAVTGLAGGATQLTSDDYSVTPTSETTNIGAGEPVNAHTRVTVELNETGLAKIWAAKAQNNAAQVQVTITTTSNAIGNGVIPNNVVLFPNQYQVDNNPGGIPSEYVETRLGSISIEKTDLDGTTPLADAVFAVFISEDDAREGALDNAIDIPGQPLGTKTVTTDSDGAAVIAGLRLSNFVNGVEVAEEADYRSYYLVEVKAPEGYELLSDPIKVNLLDEGASVDLGFVYEAEVRNAPHNAGFELPQTGGTGSMIFLIIGLGTVMVGAALLLRRRSKHTA